MADHRHANTANDGFAQGSVDTQAEMAAFDRLPPEVKDLLRYGAVKILAVDVRGALRSNGPAATVGLILQTEGRIMRSKEGPRSVTIAPPWSPLEPARKPRTPDYEARRPPRARGGSARDLGLIGLRRR